MADIRHVNKEKEQLVWPIQYCKSIQIIQAGELCLEPTAKYHVKGYNINEGLVSVRKGRCQNWKMSEMKSLRIGNCRNWKVSEFENVRIGKCQNWQVSKLKSVRIGKFQNWEVTVKESVRIGMLSC